jgi:hypothetical protein
MGLNIIKSYTIMTRGKWASTLYCACLIEFLQIWRHFTTTIYYILIPIYNGKDQEERRCRSVSVSIRMRAELIV